MRMKWNEMLTGVWILMAGVSQYFCQNSPVIHGAPNHISLLEGLRNGTVLFNFTATHADAGEYITIKIGNSETADIVFVNQTHGRNIEVQVITRTILDSDGNGYPGTGQVTLLFKATDLVRNEVGFTTILYLTDINDNNPKLENQPYSWAIKETPYFGNETFTRITATDIDYGDSGTHGIRYHMESSSAADEYRKTFEMDWNSGHVSLKKELDYETNSYYQFNVNATDDGGNGNTGIPADFIIRVLDVQDTPPFFTGIPYRTTIKENINMNSFVCNVIARDGDTGVANPVNYTILPGKCSTLFNISQDGHIHTSRDIDRDTGEVNDVSGVCVLRVLVQEIDQYPTEQYGSTNATTDVTITITDENDNPPHFGNQTYTAEVQENTPADVPITLFNSSEIRIYDADQGINAVVDISLEYPNGTPCIDFSISPSTIQQSGSALIRVVNQDLLDFEKIRNVTFLITASEASNTRHSTTATVYLNVLDMNDNNPQFTNSSYSFEVRENSATGTAVGTITATDADSGDFGNVSYSISGGHNRFVVDLSTGMITTVCGDCSSDLDREKVDIYFMTYTATDHGGRSNSTSLIIYLTDENDNVPEFTRDIYTAFIEENDSRYNMTAVIEVEANDNDEKWTDNSKIIYNISSISEQTMVGNITINTTTGQVYLNSPVDYEKLNDSTIQIIIQARDFGAPAMTSNVTVKIIVQDINDNTPTFDASTFHAHITENSTSSATNLTAVSRVSATDADGTERNSKFQFFITSGAIDDFIINSANGEVNVQINAELNREEIASYNLTVIAIDQGSPPLTGTTTMSIEIIDVNDELPVFNKLSYSVSVVENDETERIVTSCIATDVDSTSELLYTINQTDARDETGGTINSTRVTNYFGIHPNNGSIFINAPLDREVAKTIVLTIEVTDVNAYIPNPQRAQVLLTITLEDINDNSPAFDESTYSVNVSENAQNPTILGRIRATDSDENRTIQYEIMETLYPYNSFKIDRNTGILTKSGHLDREENATLTLCISATDNGVPPLSSTTDVRVTILDFNDNSPIFINFTTEITVRENASRGSVVLTVAASDIDVGPNANVTYKIDSGDEGKFTIDLMSGQLSVSGVLDREVEFEYTLRITAFDNPITSAEQMSTTKELKVILSDVNDNPPKFKYGKYSTSILENTAIRSSIKQVSAHDADEANTTNSIISYSFSSDTSPTGLFIIDEDTGLIYVNRSLIGHAGSYVLGLVAEDHAFNTTSSINITVLDVNLNTPFINNPPTNNTIKVYECVDERHIIYTFHFTDNDDGINAQAYFNISELDDRIFDTFEMKPDGTLTIIQKLNATSINSHRFQVQVTDRGTPALSSGKLTVTVKVIDVDDHLPSFQEASTSLSVNENQPAGKVVGQIAAIDKDADSVACYYIEDANRVPYFNIGMNNGSIVTTVKLDHENISTALFTVRVEDCSISSNTSECSNVTHVPDPNYRERINVTVNIIDSNDNPPVFKVDEITVGMRRVTEVWTPLDISLKTRDYIDDLDTDVNGRNAWVFTNAGDIVPSSSLGGHVNPLGGVNACEHDGKKHIICVNGNGSLVNNKYYNEDMSGYFVLPVKVSDAAGSDTVRVKIFLIGDSQILIMTILGPKEEIAENKDDILRIYSQVTGYDFVYDWLEDHKTSDGRVETFKTDLYFHVVERDTQRVLPASDAVRIADSNYEKLLQAMKDYHVLQVVPSVQSAPEEDSSVRTIYILAAVIAVLGLTVAIVIYVSLTTRNTYRRKLKAATVKPQDVLDIAETDKTVVPGSNVYSKQANPLMHADIQSIVEYDHMSMGSNNSLDSNNVGECRKESDYETMEEREVTIDMYTEDANYSSVMESALDAALRLRDIQNILDKQDNISSEGIVSTENMEVLAFDNSAYVGELESAEI